jgi:hypothetical protein
MPSDDFDDDTKATIATLAPLGGVYSRWRQGKTPKQCDDWWKRYRIFVEIRAARIDRQRAREAQRPQT